MSKIVLNTVTNRIGIHVSGARGASAADIARRTGAVPPETTDEEYAELTLVNVRVKEAQQTGVDLVDIRGRGIKSFEPDGSEFGVIHNIRPSPYAGVQVVDARGRAAELTGVSPIIEPLMPYVGPAIYAVEGEPSSLVLANMLADRSRATDTVGVLLPAAGRPMEFHNQLDFDAGTLTGPVKVAVGPMRLGLLAQSGDIDIRIADNPGSGSPVILTLGDSIAYRGGMYWANQFLTGWGYTPTWVGTLRSTGASDESTSGGLLGEPKPGHELGDFTHQIDGILPLPPGDEATYDGLSVASKRAYNTLLRASTGGDAPEDIQNGYVVDFGDYFTRHALTPATCLVLSLWTNDINALALEDVHDRIYDGYALMIRRWRAYHATHPIVIALPGTAMAPGRDALWPAYIAATRAVWAAVNDAADPNVHLVFSGPQVTAMAGYDLTAASAEPDAVTGGVVRTLKDAVHPTGAVRVETTRVFAATIAYATSNIIV